MSAMVEVKAHLVTIILGVLLLVSVFYIVFEKVQAIEVNRLQQSYQAGYNEGLTAAVVALLQKTQNCNPTTIYIQNFTRELVDTACVRQG